MENKYYIVSYEIPFGDFDIYTHKVMTQEEYDIYESKWKGIESTEIYTGVDMIDIYKSEFEVFEISQQEYDILKNMGFMKISNTEFYEPTSFIDSN